VIIDAHATVKSFVYLSTLIASAYTTMIASSSVRKWRGERKTICRNSEWNGETDTLSEIVNNKFYHLYQNYIAVGKDTDIERGALKRWYLLAFLVYFTFVLVNLVHIVRSLSKGVKKDDQLDVVHAPLNTSIFVISFLIPYCIFTWLNRCHHEYFEEMCEAYLEIKIVEPHGNIYLCNPGKDLKVLNQTEDDEGRVLINGPIPWVRVSEQDSIVVERKYREYYKEAVKPPGNMLMVKQVKFDFLPSFMMFSVSLDSEGFVLTLLLSVFSILLSFV
jgi:hypothetical protein